jgi:hypothetical protein
MVSLAWNNVDFTMKHVASPIKNDEFASKKLQSQELPG